MSALPFCRVNYLEDKPEAVNVLNIRDKQEKERVVRDFFLTKFTHWQYEHEYRFLATIDDLGGKDAIKFKKDSLASIIFGLRVNPDDAKHIKDIIDQCYKGIDVKLYRTEKIKGKYAIDVKEIKNLDKYIGLLGNE
ncbi:hypothetical protein [Methanosarcina mazei]|uniref:Uncharacterized protein n=1 Tax=Methanosarcina mazei TaxID=2209 RepID=A0A6C0VL40_METMZ|nr:hypothetical protein [Methanosarcina mazei]QIB91003.1 hypothetical protein FQU78_07990 [Methanosarcina mazei]